jgi:peptidoglycan/LPS O-acetylase OafA/YrhL
MSSNLSHRREIQGLRALAVLSVITNHLFADLLPGGFLGVDIFFLLSGYLITAQLIELSAEGRMRSNLLKFYARRIGRILPSALLVIWVTIALAYRYLGPVIGNETLRDGRWATLFFANSHFNSLKVDYFEQGKSTPLLQHYWSLAVEEQFYLVWPVVLLLIVLIFRKKTSGFLLAILTLLTIFSFCSMLIIEKTLTYFATQTRIWELSIGALVAILGTRAWPKIVQWSAVLILIGSLFIVDSTDQVPGVVVLPALLAAALLLNVTDRNLLLVLGNRVMHYLGDISFVLYLWHWPVIELHRQLSFTELSIVESISLLLITIVLAVITHHLFENPIRYNRYLTEHPTVTVISGTSAIAFSVLATYLLVKG